MKIVQVFCVVLVAIVAEAIDYCSLTCWDERTHQNIQNIGCNNKQEFAASCPANRELIDVTPFKDLIVDEHNKYRNQVATGQVPNHSPAQRMATMRWNDELAWQAVNHIVRCKFEHDQCRRTSQFTYSGQNLASKWISGGSFSDVKAEIKALIGGWFKEHVNSDMSYINSFHGTGSREIMNGHFTVMVADRNTDVGCAILITVKGGEETLMLTCNYATTNMLGHTMYTAGPTASKCTTGTNPRYPGLCSAAEKYDVNKWF